MQHINRSRTLIRMKYDHVNMHVVKAVGVKTYVADAISVKKNIHLGPQNFEFRVRMVLGLWTH